MNQKAPAGYGLGTYGRDISNQNLVDYYDKSGFYYGANITNTPDLNNWWKIIISSAGGNGYATFYAVGFWNDILYIAHCQDDTTGNPNFTGWSIVNEPRMWEVSRYVTNTEFVASAEYQSLKTSVSNGKSSIASAITDKGVSTSGTDTFATMAANIAAIPTGATIITDQNSFSVSNNVFGVRQYALPSIPSNYLIFSISQSTTSQLSDSINQIAFCGKMNGTTFGLSFRAAYQSRLGVYHISSIVESTDEYGWHYFTVTPNNNRFSLIYYNFMYW